MSFLGLGKRSYTAGRFMLHLGGETVGFMKSFSGHAMEGDVVTHDLGADNQQKKNIANIKWTDAKAKIGIGMGRKMYDWIQAAFDKNFITNHGMLTSADFNGKAQSHLEFYEALITEVTVPKLGGDLKESAYFDIGWKSERIRWTPGDGSDVGAPTGQAQSAWLNNNFRFELNGAGAQGSLPCSRVATIDSFSWKCAVSPDQIGINREPTLHPARVTVPDIKLSISMADHDAWADAAKKWFVDGHHLEQDHMNGRIVFLGPDMTTEIGEVTLGGVGFKKHAHEDREANSEKIGRFNVELYVEDMRFKINDANA